MFRIAHRVGLLAAALPALLLGGTPRTARLHMPLAFEENRGQADPEVRYLARGSGHTLQLTAKGARLDLRDGHDAVDVVGLSFLGASDRPEMSPERPLEAKANYLIGRDPSQWVTDVPTAAGVRYRGLYPGTDLVFYGAQGRFEYDWILRPGADPGRIRLAVSGAKDLRVEADGGLRLRTAHGELRQPPPTVYQEVDGVRKTVAGRFVRLGRREVGFRLGAYDRNREVVIDPAVLWAGYLGGSGDDIPNRLAQDASGNLYVIGGTGSTNFPQVGALPAGQGGYPVTGSALNQGFISKISEDGSTLIYSTYLGGTNGQTFPKGLVVDASGQVSVAGHTYATDLPTPGGLQTTSKGSSEAFVAKLNAAGNGLLWSTYLGGHDLDIAMGIAQDSAGDLWVGGQTKSSDFPTVNPLHGALSSAFYYDAFLAKVKGDGSALLFSTYLGGSRDDVATALAVDVSDSVIAAGITVSTDFPLTSPQPSLGGSGLFITRLDSTGQHVAYSVAFGGGLGTNAFPSTVLADAAGNAYVIGYGVGGAFPTTPGAYQDASGGDAFAAKLDAAGATWLYSTCFGSQSWGSGVGAVTASGQACLVAGPEVFVLDAAGQHLLGSLNLGMGVFNPMHAILGRSNDFFLTGFDSETELVTTSGVFQPAPGGYFDGMLLRLSVSNLPHITAFTAAKGTLTSGASTTLTATFSNGTGSVDHSIGSVTSGTPVSTGPLSATTTYTLTVTDGTNPVTAQATVTVVPAAVQPTVTAPAYVTAGQGGYTASIPAQAGCTYRWSITNGAFSSGTTGTSVTFTAGASGSTGLSCTVTNAAGDAAAPGTASCAIMPRPSISSFARGQALITAGTATTLTATFTGGTGSVDQGVGAVTSGTPVSTGALSADTTFTLTVTNPAGTTASTTALVHVAAAPVQPVITAPATAAPGASGLVASISPQTGCTAYWTIANGTFTAGHTGTSVTYTAGTSGSTTLSCVVTNAAGTASAPGTATTTVAGVTAYVAGSQGLVRLGAYAVDSTGVVQVQFFLDGSLVGTDPTNPYFMNAFDSTALTDGSHTLVAKATTHGHGVLSSAPLTFSIANGTADTVPPTVSASVRGSTGTIFFSAVASDNVGVAKVQYFVDGVLWATDATAPYQTSYDSTQLSNGAHTLTVLAFDYKGNQGTSGPIGFTVSN